MDTQIEQEILAAHAERLNGGLVGRDAFPPMTLDQQQILEPLLQLAEQLYKVLVPVQPSPVFVQKLGQELAQAAVWGQLSLIQRYRRAIVLSVATLGSAFSLAGLVLFYLFRRRDSIPTAPAALPVAEIH